MDKIIEALMKISFTMGIAGIIPAGIVLGYANIMHTGHHPPTAFFILISIAILGIFGAMIGLVICIWND